MKSQPIRKPRVRLTAGTQPTPCWMPYTRWGWKHDPYQSASTRLEDGSQVTLHRWMYEAVVGPIPPGKFVHHDCQRHRCVNPDHLFVHDHASHGRRHSQLAIRPTIGYRVGVTADPYEEVEV